MKLEIVELLAELTAVYGIYVGFVIPASFSCQSQSKIGSLLGVKVSIIVSKNKLPVNSAGFC